MREFWQVFEELGVKVEKYRMRDIYRSGQFNEAIDTHPAQRRQGAPRLQGSLEQRPARDTGIPFQVDLRKVRPHRRRRKSSPTTARR